MKRYIRFWLSLLVSVGLMICSMPFAVYADVNDLLISTGSNALMTMELDDDDYSMGLFSTLGTVTNTVNGRVVVTYKYYNPSTGSRYTQDRDATLSNNRFSFYNNGPDGYYLEQFAIRLYDSALPNSGVYDFSFDYSSNFGANYSYAYSQGIKLINNADAVLKTIDIYEYIDQFSGDIFMSPVTVDIGNIDRLYMFFNISDDSVNDFGGSLSLRFVLSDKEPILSFGTNISSSDYQNNVSSSLSDLSSSVGDLDDSIGDVEAGIDEVTSAIQNLQGAMEPHYANVLTQLHHITEQLHALWDQQFNLHHVPLMAKLDEIKSAIANMDLEVVVELDELKQTVNNMSQAIQNKLQSVQDGINNKLQSVQDTLTGGYNTGGIDSDQGKLEDSLTEYEEAEKNVIDKVNDSLNDFEFDSGFEEYSNTISTISDFLQALYDSSGGFKVVINLSLMLSLASLVIGFYRFKG